MKVLSVKQPWAYLLCAGIKSIENRTWRLSEKHKGKRVLIHASACKKTSIHSLTKTQFDIAFVLMDRMGITLPPFEEWSRSAIIGSVKFVDCVVNHPSSWAEKSSLDGFIRLGDEKYASKLKRVEKPIYNWVVEDAILFKRPILGVKGKLSFWDFPAHILECPQCKGLSLHDNRDIGMPNWGNPVCECEHCGYMMLESEFERME